MRLCSTFGVIVIYLILAGCTAPQGLRSLLSFPSSVAASSSASESARVPESHMLFAHAACGLLDTVRRRSKLDEAHDTGFQRAGTQVHRRRAITTPRPTGRRTMPHHGFAVVAGLHRIRDVRETRTMGSSRPIVPPKTPARTGGTALSEVVW